MLIEFSVKNYRSFKGRVILSLEATSLTSLDKELDDNTVVEADNLRLLTSAAIYGANASGKSNLVRAMDFMRSFIITSSKDSQQGEKIATEPFALNDDTINQPTEFEITFLAEGKQYRYGFEVTANRVEREWLFHVPRKSESLLFERTGQRITFKPGFKEGKGLADKTRENALFLSVAAQFNGSIAGKILLWVTTKFQVITGIQALDTDILSVHAINYLEKNATAAVVKLLQGFDTDIYDLFLEQIEGEKIIRPKTKHPIYSSEGSITGYRSFDMNEQESEGTKKLFALSSLLIQTLRYGKVLVIDEYDARLHPKITRGIIQLFNSKKSNPLHAQLIVFTHDINLLDRKLLRRDQIWLIEKDKVSSSLLYSLAELKVRNDASFENDYITAQIWRDTDHWQSGNNCGRTRRNGAVPCRSRTEMTAINGDCAVGELMCCRCVLDSLLFVKERKPEPNYFKSFPVASAVVEVIGEGYNTGSLVARAIELRDEREYTDDNDQVWCVFDKDDFEAENFNNAIQRAEREGLKVAYSNEAFELWYLLHFDYHDTALHRSQYIEKLTDRFKRKYQKNDRNLYQQLQSKQPDAIRNAARLYDRRTDSPQMIIQAPRSFFSSKH